MVFFQIIINIFIYLYNISIVQKIKDMKTAFNEVMKLLRFKILLNMKVRKLFSIRLKTSNMNLRDFVVVIKRAVLTLCISEETPLKGHPH